MLFKKMAPFNKNDPLLLLKIIFIDKHIVFLWLLYGKCIGFIILFRILIIN